ncbi:membrane bound O-acyl transferase family-domain-containing protein [Hygrophoropsis aurantiaca]|uniref:Membrane bound O-acyl transferase family-domain-containing protein n=1 Tax=Hygrophoropsis aurantiaca TaxID=72124 RepID=A0ACB8AFE6_9AGAM|nr:membrane bound O-acyl transferase family-domain-containing protein [Hygrophoropsis aurantiaca]
MPTRRPVTVGNFATTFLPVLFFYYTMAVLVQRKHTFQYRLALLPLILCLAFHMGTSLDFSGGSPGHVFLNQGLALAMFTVAMRTITWTFAKEPYRRTGLTYENSDKKRPLSRDHTPDFTLGEAMWNAWDLIMNLRGLGWNWSRTFHIPAPTFHTSSVPFFLAQSIIRLVFYVLAFDIASASIRSFSPDTFGSIRGGSIFDVSLAPIPRYMRASVISVLSAWTAYFIIETVYQIHAIIFVLLFRQRPSQWPPLFDSPWMSTSLAEFWGQKWHQLFRECFTAVGSRPFRHYLGRTGGIFGAFLASGMLHDVGLRGMDRGGDTIAVIGFFMMNALGLTLEYAWKKQTGNKVGGIGGWLWALVWLVTWGNLMVDAWGRTGLVGSDFFPEIYRPSKLILGRFAKYLP